MPPVGEWCKDEQQDDNNNNNNSDATEPGPTDKKKNGKNKMQKSHTHTHTLADGKCRNAAKKLSLKMSFTKTFSVKIHRSAHQLKGKSPLFGDQRHPANRWHPVFFAIATEEPSSAMASKWLAQHTLCTRRLCATANAQVREPRHFHSVLAIFSFVPFGFFSFFILRRRSCETFQMHLMGLKWKIDCDASQQYVEEMKMKAKMELARERVFVSLAMR